MRACVVAAAALVALAACGGARTTGVSSPPTWASIAGGIRPALDPRSANPCQRGAPVCFDVIVAELRRREQALAQACDHNALWADLYTLMIERIRVAARAGKFRNAPQITHFDALFARSYFNAFDSWHADAGRRGVPGAWAAAFDTADGRSVRGLGDLLLGLNAHVSRDLAHAVADTFVGPGTARDPDYVVISGLVQQVSPKALADISARFDPTIAITELPLGLSGGRASFGSLVEAWTSEAWLNGKALRNAAPGDRAAVEQRIERTSLLRARTIAAAMSYLPGLGGSRARDAYCAAHSGKRTVARGTTAPDPTVLCDLSPRCTRLVARWTRIEGLRGRAVVGAKAFYLNGCLACHTYLGDGERRLAAVDLTAEAKRHRGVEWQVRLLRCPSCVFVGVPMPPLPFIRARDVAIFLEASKGRR